MIEMTTRMGMGTTGTMWKLGKLGKFETNEGDEMEGAEKPRSLESGPRMTTQSGQEAAQIEAQTPAGEHRD
jgi:hypothetical protein